MGRQVRNSEPALARAIDPHALPGRQRPLADELRELGLPEARVPDGEALILEYAIRFAGEYVRHVLRKLGPTPAERALERVLLGADQSFAADAAEVGTSAPALFIATERIKKRLKKTG